MLIDQVWVNGVEMANITTLRFEEHNIFLGLRPPQPRRPRELNRGGIRS